MNIREAKEILELSPNSSLDEAKQKYKELAKKYHPDINKESNAAKKMQEINDAFNYLKKHNESKGRFERISFTDINLNTTVSFKESVLGCKKEFSFTRNAQCQFCNGRGKIKLNNGCKKCNGSGTITQTQKSQYQSFIFTSTCDSCQGLHQTNECSSCFGSGCNESEVNINVNIPPGVVDGNILKVSGMGHYVSNFMGMDHTTDVLIYITVNPESNLSLDNEGNVVSHISLSLLEALQGTEKEVVTIFGNQKINIQPLSKNKDEVILPNLGVNKVKSQRVILQVEYPQNIDLLINNLKELN